MILKQQKLPQKISIHALVKRATNIIIFVHNLGFISIHALVKRATYHFSMIKCELVHFNPRPREEGDALLFNPFTIFKDFNPRPREEGDFNIFLFIFCHWISIHALVKRATNFA